MNMQDIHIIGAGVVGLTTALELATRGVAVTVHERAADVGPHHCSWYAGGMLAPWCERENAEPLIAVLGAESLAWWSNHVAVAHTGTLVVAQGRDVIELQRFAARTTHLEKIGAEDIASLEPDLAGRFQQALYFASEAMLDPRVALPTLLDKLRNLNVTVRFNDEQSVSALQNKSDWVIDCRGLAARNDVKELRGVKGDMLLLRTHDIHLHRPVRMLHPRIPVYIVPRADGVFMVGATMIESDDDRHVSARSLMELLNAAYALHPAFGEAEIVEIGTQVRPAFADNLPRIIRDQNVLHINGCYRHGYLTAPALALRAAEIILNQAYFPEVMDEYPGQWQSA